MVSHWRKYTQMIVPLLLILPTAYFVYLFTVRPAYNVLQDSQIYFRPNRPDRLSRTPTDLQLPDVEPAQRSLRGPHDVDWAYFKAIWDDQAEEGKIFRQVMKNTFIYVVTTVPISMILAFLFALLVNRGVRGIGFARAAFFAPTLLPMVSAATIWAFFFTPEIGLWNTVLGWFGHDVTSDWIIDPGLALYALIIVAIWKNAGYFMIFYLAGMQNLPDDVYEAARLDGANWLTQTIQITFPLLRRTTLFVSVIAIIGAFQTVDHALVLVGELVTGEADLLLYAIYDERFGDSRNYGFANALTVILIGILLVITVINFMISERESE